MPIDETFDIAHGLYLDKNTSLFETLSNITPDAASIPVGRKRAPSAAQVKHASFYLEVEEKKTFDTQLVRKRIGAKYGVR